MENLYRIACRLAVHIVCAVVSMAVMATTLEAVERPCVPDCPETPFGANQRAVLTLPNGCVVRVTFSTRIPECFTPPVYDVAIVQIEYLNGACSGSLTSLVEAVTQQLLLTNPMFFPMPTLGCLNHYRVTKAVCWRIDSLLDCDGDTLAVPCDSSGCCLSRYRLCRDSSGVFTVTKLNSYVPVGSDTCNADSLSEHANTCFGGGELRGSTTSSQEVHMLATTARLAVRPNPAGDQIIVSGTGEVRGRWTLRVVNALGEQVSLLTGESAHGIRELVLDVGSLATGAYSLSLDAGGSVIGGAFIKR